MTRRQLRRVRKTSYVFEYKWDAMRDDWDCHRHDRTVMGLKPSRYPSYDAMAVSDMPSLSLSFPPLFPPLNPLPPLSCWTGVP